MRVASAADINRNATCRGGQNPRAVLGDNGMVRSALGAKFGDAYREYRKRTWFWEKSPMLSAYQKHFLGHQAYSGSLVNVTAAKVWR